MIRYFSADVFFAFLWLINSNLPQSICKMLFI